jgi:hypothetical protein
VDAEEYGVTRLLGELAPELQEGRYRPLPARRVFIPKPGTSEQRPLSIPAVRDRVVRAAAKIVLEPVFGGIKQVLLSPNHLGLIGLDGTVRPPRAYRDWRGNTERRR